MISAKLILLMLGLVLLTGTSSADYINVNTTGWWREGGSFNTSSIPITHALDNLSSSGGTLNLSADVFSINNEVPIILDTNSTVFTGQGMDSTELVYTGFPTPPSPGNAMIYAVDLDSIQIKDMYIRSTDSGGAVVTAGYAIHFRRVDDSQITRVKTQYFRGGFQSNLGDNEQGWVVDNLTMSECIHTHNYVGAGNVFITNSRFMNNVFNHSGSHCGLEFNSGCDDNWIEGNTVHNVQYGFKFYVGCDNNTYYNNVVRNSNYGFAVQNCRIGNIIKNNFMYDNTFQAVYIEGSHAYTVDVESNTIYGNGGGIICTGSYSVDAKDNIIVNNTGNGMDGAGITSTYNNVWGNTVDYSGASSGTGDISLNPLFINAASHDFHLKSTGGRWDGSTWVTDSVSSPCINAGDPSSVYSEEPSLNGGRINMGVYGNTSEASKSSSGNKTDDFESYPIGSFNNTGQSNWSVKQGTWQIISNGTQKLESSTQSRIQYLNYSQRNYNVSADMMFNSSSSYLGMFTRWDGTWGTGYLVSCSVSGNTIGLYTQRTASTYLSLKQESFTFNSYQEYELKVQMNDSVLTVYVDGIEALNYTDCYRVDTIMSESGSVGLYSYGGSVYFDNFSVTTLTENSEYLNYFDYTIADTNSVTLNWSLTGYTNATIKRGTDIDIINTEIYHGSSTSYIDGGLSTDTNYYYSIIYDNSTEGHIIKAFTYELPTTRKYVSFGDSISTDYGSLQTNESFPYLVNQTIYTNNDVDITHNISAIAGYTTNGIIFGQLADILTKKPTFITLMAGWNDFNVNHDEDDYHANFKYIINESTKHGIDCFVLKMVNTSTAGVQLHINDTNTWIDSLGQQYVVNTYDAVDLTPFDGIIQGYDSSFYQDGIHPNLAGTTNLNKSIHDYMVSVDYFYVWSPSIFGNYYNISNQIEITVKGYDDGSNVFSRTSTQLDNNATSFKMVVTTT